MKLTIRAKLILVVLVLAALALAPTVVFAGFQVAGL